MINMGSNDYLSIPSRAIPGSHTSSSRLIAGNDEAYSQTEELLAGNRGHQAALIYPTGYMAISGCIPVLAMQGQTILSDELNHASIIEGCRLSGAKTRIYAHNDMQDLESKLAQSGEDSIVITEGIFSMDGDHAMLQDTCRIAADHGAFVIVDDAHGDFVVGEGHGTPRMMGVENDTYCIMSSLSKALGAFGGYIAGDQDVIEMLINTSRPFMYTSALPTGIVQDILYRLQYDADMQRRRLERNVNRLATGLEQMGLCQGPQTHIIPVMVGDERNATAISDELARRGVYARAIRYPTVARGSARIRISVTAALSDDDIDCVLEAFDGVTSSMRS